MDKVKNAVNCTCFDCGLNNYNRTALIRHHDTTHHRLLCYNCDLNLSDHSKYQKEIHFQYCTLKVACSVCAVEIGAVELNVHLRTSHNQEPIPCPFGCNHLYRHYRNYVEKYKSHVCNQEVVVLPPTIPVAIEDESEVNVGHVPNNHTVETLTLPPLHETTPSLQGNSSPLDVSTSSHESTSSHHESGRSHTDLGEGESSEEEEEFTTQSAIEQTFLNLKKSGCTNAALDTLAKDLAVVLNCINSQENVQVTLPRTVTTSYMREKYIFENCGPTGELHPIRLTKSRQGEYGIRYYKSIKSTIFELSKDTKLVKEWENNYKGVGRLHHRKWHDHGSKVYWHPLLCSRAKTVDPNNGKLTLFLEEYSDGVSHTQGSQRSKKSYEMTHAYFGIRNIAGPASRQVQYFKTHTLHFKKDYRRTEERLMWAHFITEMKELCTNGMTLANGQSVNIRLFVLSGDQKELHERLGLSTCYTTDHCDRYGESLKVNRRNAESSTDMKNTMTRRTVESLEADYLRVETRECNSSHGVKCRPIINSIPHFHAGQFPSTSACYGHDVLSGAFKDDLVLILRLWMKQGLTSNVEIEELIMAFKSRLDPTTRCNYVGESTYQRGKSFSIPGNMCQMETLFCHLPQIFARLEQRYSLADDPTWVMMRLMSRIVRLLASFALSEHQVNTLDVMYNQYVKNRFYVEETWRAMRRQEEGERVYTDMAYKKPKHATITLYPELIRELGPLALYNTMLGETKNGLLSGGSKRSCNYKNVIKSTAKRLHIAENSPWEHVEHLEKTALKGPLRDTVKKQLDGLLGCEPEIFKRVKINSINFTCGDYLPYYPLDDKSCKSYLLGQIYVIVKKDHETYFIVQKCISRYISKFECFAVKPESDVEVITMCDLACHKPYKQLSIPPCLFDENLDAYTNIIVPVVTPTLL